MRRADRSGWRMTADVWLPPVVAMGAMSIAASGLIAPALFWNVAWTSAALSALHGHPRRPPGGRARQPGAMDALGGSVRLLAVRATRLGSVRSHRLSRLTQPGRCRLVGLRGAGDAQHAAQPRAVAPGSARRRRRDAAGRRCRRRPGLCGAVARRVRLDPRAGGEDLGAGLPGPVCLRRRTHGPGDDRWLADRIALARTAGDAGRHGCAGGRLQPVEHPAAGGHVCRPAARRWIPSGCVGLVAIGAGGHLGRALARSRV